MAGPGEKPRWLHGLTEETFSGRCGAHEGMKNNVKNLFCIPCCTPICPYCGPSHPSHPVLRVRRHQYKDVAKMVDLERLIDCSLIQTYTANDSKVIYLKSRPQTKKPPNRRCCVVCDRYVQESYIYCSLNCKVKHLPAMGMGISSILRQIDESELRIPELETLPMEGSEDEAVDLNSAMKDCWPCRGSTSGSGASSQRSEEKRKKTMSDDSYHSSSSSKRASPCRRKGVPHRSPFS